MMCRVVSLVLSFLISVYTAPVPDSAKISLIRNSVFGFGLAVRNSESVGVFKGNSNLEIVKNVVEESRPDFSLVENVNSGAAFAIDKSISIGVIKDNIFAGKNPFGKK